MRDDAPTPHPTHRTRRGFVLTLLLLFLVGLLLGGCGGRTEVDTPSPRKYSKATQRPYTIKGKTYKPIPSAEGFVEEGLASWYGHPFHGRKTASGDVYDMDKMTAAHKILPMGTVVRVEDLSTGASVDVLVNDRGPFVRARVIDLSREAARRLGMIERGTARVRVTALTAVPRDERGDIVGRFYVQVGSFTVERNARRLQAAISRRHQGSRIQRAVVGGMTFWRVQAGVFGSLAEARRQQGALETVYPDCFVIAD